MVLKLDDFAPDERKIFDGNVEEVLSSDEYKRQIQSNLAAHGNVESLDQAPLIVEKVLSSDEYKRQIKSNLAAHDNVESLDEAPLIPVADDYNKSVGHNVGAIRKADKELKAEEITRTLDSIEQMTQSIQEVTNTTRTASSTAEAGEVIMDRTWLTDKTGGRGRFNPLYKGISGLL